MNKGLLYNAIHVLHVILYNFSRLTRYDISFYFLNQYNYYLNNRINHYKKIKIQYFSPLCASKSSFRYTNILNFFFSFKQYKKT